MLGKITATGELLANVGKKNKERKGSEGHLVYEVSETILATTASAAEKMNNE